MSEKDSETIEGLVDFAEEFLEAYEEAIKLAHEVSE